MELIKGVPITEYCDRARLAPRERLALFVPVCEAVQHAHQKGLVHRDLKPSNILVALYDGRPVPKVIDFGIAKATGGRLTDRSIYTEVGALVGTLEYMAPEQAELNNLDIDTRADVYALGAILYELLTGSVPFSRQDLQAAGFLEMLRVIKEVEPPRPSTKLSKSGTLPSVADVRRTEPQKLVSLMRGELDWIILKCLEKDRGRRYQAASGLARDLEHYLADEPVEACSPTAGYRLRKFARKYRTPMLVVGAFVLLLALGAIVAAWQAVRATSAEWVAKRAEFEAKEERLAALVAKQQALEAKAETETQRDEARVAAYASGMGLAQRAWEENNVVRARELLAELPSEAAGRNLRGFEWFYLSRLCHPDELTLKGHAGAVCGVAFSPDGQRLASASGDQTVKIRDSATGRELFALKGHAGWVNSVAFSPDGQRLASASNDQTVRIWDSATGKELFALKGHAGVVVGVAFSPDGQRLASASHDQTVKIWDSATGKELFAFKGHAGMVLSVAFSPDGQRLASASEDQTVKIWDSATGKELFALKGHAGWVSSVAFSPDGQRLASGSNDQTVKVWDSATGKELFALKGHADRVWGVAFSPDGHRLASASWDQTVKIWDSATGKELVALKGHADVVSSVAFSPDGQRLASASWDQTVRIWDSATGKELVALKGHAGMVSSVAFSPDGQRLASANQDGIDLWETASVSREIQHRRATNQMMAGLLGQMPLRADVLERLRTLPGMSPSRRQEVIAVAETYPVNPSELNDLAWQLVKLPGGEMSGHRKALRYSEEACQLEPEDGSFLTTLGVAYYRVGNYEKALDVLARSDKINVLRDKGSGPADLAFLAMAHQRLGHAKEAEAALQLLRERMKDPRSAQDAQAQGFLREVEALLARPKAPGSK
jgi:WD40 repeat protein